jgi:hypothetical protein
MAVGSGPRSPTIPPRVLATVMPLQPSRDSWIERRVGGSASIRPSLASGRGRRHRRRDIPPDDGPCGLSHFLRRHVSPPPAEPPSAPLEGDLLDDREREAAAFPHRGSCFRCQGKCAPSLRDCAQRRLLIDDVSTIILASGGPSRLLPAGDVAVETTGACFPICALELGSAGHLWREVRTVPAALGARTGTNGGRCGGPPCEISDALAAHHRDPSPAPIRGCRSSGRCGGLSKGSLVAAGGVHPSDADAQTLAKPTK